MLELLNPTPLDVTRFAIQAVGFRFKVGRLYATSPELAYRLIARRFITPPEHARRAPTIERVRMDAKRYFGMSDSEWARIEPRVQTIIQGAARSSIRHLGKNVQCYRWQALGKQKGSHRGCMLLCHGWEGYAFNFVALVATAVETGWDVVAFDHLAHGDSGGTESGLPIFLSTLVSVVKQIGPIDILVGHSLGAAASAWAVAHGQINTRRLILLAPFYDTNKLTRIWARAHLLAPHYVEGLQRELEAMAQLKLEDFMPSTLGPHLRTSTLILHDPKDPITAFKHSQNMAQTNRNVRLVRADGLGHIRLIADSGQIASIVKFASSNA
jgi:pimeloyl-ACP methyl ester carboxylesterase